MNNIKVLKLGVSDYPQKLTRLSSPPKQLYCLGKDLFELYSHKVVAIVGSRRINGYAKDITSRLASELASSGIIIVSGLAVGVDSIAQQAALDTGGKVIAVLPSPVDNVLPRTNAPLAKQIIKQGGALVSEYPSREPAFKQNFIARNRIVAGFADLLLITAAAEKSGSLHTARFALEIGVDVAVIPGNVNDPIYAGSNQLIKSGAALVTESTDIFNLLGIDKIQTRIPSKGRNNNEQIILDLVSNGVSRGAEIMQISRLNSEDYSRSMIMLEISGKIKPLGADNWTVA